MAADALRDPTTGVAAQLAAVPIDGADARPPAPVVVDESSTPWVARRRVPADWRTPTVAVMQAGAATMAGEAIATYRSVDVTLGVQIVAPLVASADAIQALHYTVRATQRALRVWLRDASEAARTRGTVYVERSEAWTQGEVESSDEDGVSVVTLTVTLTVRDTEP